MINSISFSECPSVPGNGTSPYASKTLRDNPGAFYESSYYYSHRHRWRNGGIVITFTVLFAVVHLWLSDIISAERSKGQVLVFQRSKLLKAKAKPSKIDEEHLGSELVSFGAWNESDSNVNVEKQQSAFHWENVCYGIQIKANQRGYATDPGQCW